MKIQATATFDREDGTLTVDLPLVGESELDHELLAAFFVGRSVSISPMHQGDLLGAQFTIHDPSAFDAALHNLENRKRKNDGRPTIEEEAAKAKAANATVEADRENAKTREDQNQAELAKAKARIEKRAAEIIADRLDEKKAEPAAPQHVEQKKDEEAPTAKEPSKVQ